MDYQYYETDKDELWEFIWVHFNGATSRGYYKQYTKSSSPVITIGSDSNIQSILKSLLNIHKVKGKNTEQLSSKLIVELLTELLLVNDDINSSGGYTPDYIKQMTDYLDKHFEGKSI